MKYRVESIYCVKRCKFGRHHAVGYQETQAYREQVASRALT